MFYFFIFAKAYSNSYNIIYFCSQTESCFCFYLQNSASHSSSSEVDEGPAAKLARFTNDLIAENHQRKAINTNQSKRKLLYESTDGNASDDDVIVLLLKSHLIGAQCYFPLFQDDCHIPSYFDNTVIKVQTNGFDADSEGSDSEIILKMNNMVEEQSENSKFQLYGMKELTISIL